MAYGSLNADAVTNSTGETSSGLYGFKNRIINGAMVIDQRNAGASQTITAAAALAYTVDRWYTYCTGANVTGQQVAGATTSQFRYRFTGAASVTTIGFGQRIEQKNCYDLNGTTATLSVDLANSLLTTITWTASYATTTADTFGTLASPTVTQIATGTFTVTSTVTNYNAQISIPAAATTGIQIVFTVGAQTSGTWTVGNAQLEKGSTATSFDYRSYGTELALCQRYYQKYSNSASGLIGFIGQVQSLTTSSFGMYLSMRSTPTVGFSSINLNDGNSNPSVTSIATTATTTGISTFTATASGGGLSIGRASNIYVTTSGYLDLSSEL